MSAARILLNENKSLVLDGANGSTLETRGVKLHPVLWSGVALLPEYKEAQDSLFRDYFAAGANVISTSTYQASANTFSSICNSEKAEEYITNGVRSAKEFSAGKAHSPSLRLVSASLGPYGAMLLNGQEYSGDYGDVSFKTLYDFQLPRVKALLAGEPDILLMETIPHNLEIKALMKIIEELKPTMPVWLSLSVKHGEPKLADGTPFSEIELRPEVEVIGVNCLPPRHVSAALDGLKHFNLPKIVYPNSNEVYDAVNKVWLPATDSESGSSNASFCSENSSCAASLGCWDIDTWHAKGARIFGGCCRITPREIAEVAKKVQTLN